MKIKQGFILSKIGNDTVAIATGELSRTFSGVIMLNGTGVFLWERLQQDTTREQLVADMLEHYDVSRAEATEDINTFIEQLKAGGVLE
ncbi:MAG: PqqD family protein [Eubacteriales bacterium]|nr:PqqD family protein [Eubacteriales bacterium]MDY4897480.1 PqqD family protein [Eubacteriales bacterium]